LIDYNRKKFLLLAFVLALVGACATLPPTQEMSDARQALQAAEEIGARQLLERRMQRVESLLRRAEQRLAVREYALARGDARAAKQKANRIREVVWMIKQAQDAIAGLPAGDPRRSGLEERLDDAVSAARAGRDERAMTLSQQVLDAVGTGRGH